MTHGPDTWLQVERDDALALAPAPGRPAARDDDDRSLTAGPESQQSWWWLAMVAVVALCAVALVVARGTDLGAMTDLGLTSVLPPVYFAALAVLAISFALHVRRPRLSSPLLAIHVLVLVFMLYGVAPLLEQTARTAITWKLRGISQYISSTGTIDPGIDAFFNWPGFFILASFFTKLAGIDDPQSSFMGWAPVFFQTIYLAALFMLLRSASTDPRLPWLGIWLFAMANWIGQDYFAPQALSFFMYIVILGVLVTWFSRTRESRSRTRPRTGTLGRVQGYLRRIDRRAPSTAWQRVGLLAVVVVIFAAIVPTHQLTPFAIVAIVGVLVLCRRLDVRGLPTLMMALTACWISFMAVGYLAGNFQHVVSPVGAVGENVNSNLTARLHGSEGHLFVNYFRLGISSLIWLLALIGALRRARTGRADATLALIAVTPFLLLPMQAYGGELLLRVYLFSLPAMVFFAAAALLPAKRTTISWPATIAIACTGMTLTGAFLVARYGDERMHYFTPTELAGIEELYKRSQPGSRLVAINRNVPWRYKQYDTHKYHYADNEILAKGALGLIETMSTDGPPTYLVISSSQLAAAEITAGWRRGQWDHIKQQLLRSGAARKIYANPTTEIFIGVPSGVPKPKPANTTANSTGPTLEQTAAGVVR